MAYEDEFIWIRGFSKVEIERTEVLQLPAAHRFMLRETNLYRIGNQLPDRVEPSLLWTPIHRGLRLKLPNQNFNYFGIDQSHAISITPSNQAKPITATLIDLKSLQAYISTASNIRVQNLKWTIIDQQNAFVIGTPLLPVWGDEYYQQACFFISAGWKIRYQKMASTYQKSLPDQLDHWYILRPDQPIAKIQKSAFTPLNKGSLIKSLVALKGL